MEKIVKPKDVPCPVCAGAYGGLCKLLPTTGDNRKYACDACGVFKISDTVLADSADERGLVASPLQRAYIAHQLAKAQSSGSDVMIVSSWLSHTLKTAKLLTPPEQGRRLIEIIGDLVSKSSEAVRQFDPWVYPLVGVLDRSRLNRVFEELRRTGLVIGTEIPDTYDGPGHFSKIDLTFEGWEKYENRKSGRSPGNFGFLAMQYGDPQLEAFCSEKIKPAVLERLSLELVDLRDVSQASVIDNLMRAQIRDSAFVLADLTHDNSGAYWEAGYAEGLGKPVIYLCETSKFALAKTHFDTNHCYTVLWDFEHSEKAIDELIATIRRSLNLFPE